jgi:hypothetical protein
MAKRVFIIGLVALFCHGRACGQALDLGSWNVVNLTVNASEKWSFFGEAQLRSLQFYNQFHYYEYKGGVNYSLHDKVKVSLAAGSYQTYGEGGNFRLPKNNNEFRLWPQLIIYNNINRLKLEQRYRVEMRWTSNGYRNRFRYRIGVSYPFGKNVNGYHPFSASISNELFFTDREPYFERNRSQIALNYRATAGTTLQVGFINQFDYRINDETGRNFLVLGFYREIFNKKVRKTGRVAELKDN